MVILTNFYCFSQESYYNCANNIGFENGTLQNWTLGSSTPTPVPYFNSCCSGNTPNIGITNSSMANDPNTNVSVVAPNGSLYSVKLGSSWQGSPIMISQLKRTININSLNTLFTYYYCYALTQCLENPAPDNPSGIICFLDQNNDTIPCSKVYHNSKDNNILGFTIDSTIIAGDWVPFFYQSWQKKTIDLSAYIGQSITACFAVKNCSSSLHPGYMYLDVSCNDYKTNIISCESDSTLCAPNDCDSYLWTTPLGSHFTSQCITANQEGQYLLKIPTQKGCLLDTTTLFYNFDKQQPLADFSYSTSCQSLDYSFSDLSTIDTNAACNRTWQISGNTFTNPNLNYHFNSPDIYTVSLIATNCNNMCSDTITKTIKVSPPIIASLDFQQYACEGDYISFLNTSTNISDFFWDFGFSQSSLTNPVIQYNASGIYTVALIVKDSLGCMDSTNSQIYITSYPEVNILANNTCLGNESSITGNLLNSVPISQWQWDFQNDGSIDSQYQNTHTTFNSFGSHWIKLFVTSVYGCVAKDSLLIQIYPLPNANFYISNQNNPIIEYTNSSTPGFNSSLVYSVWDFGDNTYQNIMTPSISYTYTQPGVYTTFLTVSNNHGCTDTVSHSITIASEYAIYVPNTFTPNNDGLNDEFKIKYFNIKDSELTIFDRWGTLIYKSENKDESWSGFIKGSNPAKQDVYVWQILFSEFSGKTHNMTGHVTLIR